MRSLLLLALLTLPALVAQEAPAPVATQIDALIAKSFVADAPGASVLVVSHGEVVLRKGYGLANVELSVPLRPEHVFRLGSITKQFTAVAILQLVDAGKLKLDDDITTYVPEVETNGARITLAHLLTHTSGLPSFTDQPAWRAKPREDMTLAQELAFIKGVPAHFAPGADWSYCNTGYRLLGAVIEKVTGQSYAAYVDEHIFNPAGMTHSSYDDTRRITPLRVPGYSRRGGGAEVNAEFVSMTQPHAAGALLSSVDDLWLWEQALTAGKLLRPELLALAFTPGKLNDGRTTGYGFGWSVGTIAGHAAASHGGGIQGFSTAVLRVPDTGIFVAVLCNSDNPPAQPTVMARRIAELILGKPEFAATFVPPGTLRAFAGTYRVSPTEKFGFVVEKDRLVFQDAAGRSRPLDAIAANEFVHAADDSHYTFAREGEAPVTRVRVHPSFAPEKIGRRVDEPLKDAEKPLFTIAPQALDKFVGEYQLAPNFFMTIRRNGDALTAQATNQGVTNLIAESATRFRVRQVRAAFEFKLDDAGNVTALVLEQNGREARGKKIK